MTFTGAFGAAVAVIFATSAAAAQNQFLTGNWSGGVVFEGGRFNHCHVGVGYTDGKRLTFMLTAQMALTITATKSDWNMDPNHTYNVAFEIDPSFKRSYRGVVRADRRNSISFAIGNDSTLRQAMAGGGTMNWTDSGGQRFSFALTNANNAMRKLLACTALYGVE